MVRRKREKGQPEEGQGQTVLDGHTGPGVWEPWMAFVLDRIDLAHGSHGGNPWRGACINEAIALVTGQKFTDRPVCVATPYRDRGIDLNDSATSTEQRNKLKPLIPLMVNTHPLDEHGQPIQGEEIEQKNKERAKALSERVDGDDFWDERLKAFEEVLKEVG